MAWELNKDKAKQAADAAFELVEGSLPSITLPVFGNVSRVFAGLAWFMVAVVGYVYAASLALIMFVAPEFARGVLTLVADARKENPKELTETVVAALSELLMVDFTAEDVPYGQGKDALLARMEVLGSKLHTLLTDEFTNQGVAGGEGGTQAAKRWTGFLMSTAVSSALLGILGEVMSLGHFKEFRELGDNLGNRLGLGRLHRDALKPLIRNLVSEPYNRALSYQYRQDRLSDRQYVDAFYAGRLSREEMYKLLGEKGYRDSDIDELVAQIPPDLNQGQLVHLMRYGELNGEQVVQQLRDMGWPEAFARMRVRATLLSRLDSYEGDYLSTITTLRLHREIEQDTFEKLLERLHLTDEEKQLVRDRVGTELDSPQAHISWTEVKAAFEAGVCDFDYVDRWLEREGYSDEDQLIREFMLLSDADKKAGKAQAAADKAARAAARAGGLTPPKAP